jgi:hypothetical protein
MGPMPAIPPTHELFFAAGSSAPLFDSLRHVIALKDSIIEKAATGPWPPTRVDVHLPEEPWWKESAMTTLLGAALAIAGGFLAQWYANRLAETRKRRHLVRAIVHDVRVVRRAIVAQRKRAGERNHPGAALTQELAFATDHFPEVRSDLTLVELEKTINDILSWYDGVRLARAWARNLEERYVAFLSEGHETDAEQERQFEKLGQKLDALVADGRTIIEQLAPEMLSRYSFLDSD